MIEEPYRWIEAIRNRREYIETQLERGSPLVLLGFDEGLLLFTLSGETRKLFEVYDRIGFAALGHPADIERMRLAAIDLAHVEGFSRAVNDVSVRRLVNFGLSPALKTAFEQVFSAPFIVKMLLAEIGDQPADDVIMKLDYDGSFGRSQVHVSNPYEVVAGTPAAEEIMLRVLTGSGSAAQRSLADALHLASRAWTAGMRRAEQSAAEAAEEKRGEDLVGDEQLARLFREQLRTRQPEVAVLDRAAGMTDRFRRLDEKQVRVLLKER